MKQLYDLEELFSGYKEKGIFRESDSLYKRIVPLDSTGVKKEVMTWALGWGEGICSNPSLHLDSKLTKLQHLYEDATSLYARKEEVGDWEYRRLSYAYWKGAVFYAAVLYKECARVGKCANVFFIGKDNLEDALKYMGWDEFDDYYCDLCESCSELHCPFRAADYKPDTTTRSTPQLVTVIDIDKLFKEEDARAKRIWQIAIDAKYLDENRKFITKGHTFRERAIVAHEIGTRLGLNYDKFFQQFWGCRSLSSEYHQATDSKKREIAALFQVT